MAFRTTARIVALVTALACPALAAATSGVAARPEVRDFIARMVTEHAFSAEELEGVFRDVQIRPDILQAISRPAESKPWYQYRPIFVTADRIRQGLTFWNEHERTLERAEATYGVSASVIVAILGVETRYGRHTGNYRVVDALSTLAFDYPPRADFFRGQLEEYLLMTREERLSPLEMLGSYAGAMGKPQFIPSSFRAYAVDFDADGRRDLWNNVEDAIGSVANYFRLHGWRAGAPVALRARLREEGARDLVATGTLKPEMRYGELKGRGVEVAEAIDEQTPAALIALEGENGPEYWLTFHNFYVITRYNRSALYAMAVHQLSRALLAARGGSSSARQ